MIKHIKIEQICKNMQYEIVNLNSLDNETNFYPTQHLFSI